MGRGLYCRGDDIAQDGCLEKQDDLSLAKSPIVKQANYRLKSKYIRERTTDRNVTMLCFLIAVFVCVFSFFPLTGNLLNIECVIIGFGILFLNYRDEHYVPVIPVTLLCVGTLFLLAITGRFGERGFNAPIANAYKYAFLFICAVLSVFTLGLDEQRKALVVKAAIMVYVFTELISIYYAVFVNEEAIRYAHRLGFRFVAIFDQVFAAPLAMSCLVLMLRKGNLSWFDKWFAVGGVVITGLFSFLSGIMTCFLLTAIGASAAFVLSAKGSKKKYVFILLAVIIVCAVVYVYRQQISDAIYRITENLAPDFRRRIRYVTDEMLGTEHYNEGYEHEGRERLIEVSVNSFKRSPIFGVGYWEYGILTIGAHTEWIDMLGVFGLVGTALFGISAFILCRSIFLRIDNKTDRISFLISLGITFVLGFIDPCLMMPVMMMAFVVAPNISSVAESRKQSITRPHHLYIRERDELHA